MKVTTALLKVVVSILGDDASARFLIETQFLSRNEDEQVYLVEQLVQQRSFAEETPQIEVKSSDPVDDFHWVEPEDLTFTEEEQRQLDELDSSMDEVLGTIIKQPVQKAIAHKRHQNKPQDKQRYYFWKKVTRRTR